MLTIDGYIRYIIDAPDQNHLDHATALAVRSAGGLQWASAEELYRISSASEARTQELHEARHPIC